MPFFNLCDTVGVSNLLVPYFLSNDNTVVSYNGRNIRPAAVNAEYDVFGVATNVGGFVPDDYLKYRNASGQDEYSNDGSTWINAALGSFINSLQDEDQLVDAWANMSQYDALSTRSFLGRPNPAPQRNDDGHVIPNPLYPGLPVAVIEWLEMLNTATGLYNNSFLESVSRLRNVLAALAHDGFFQVIDASEFGDVSAPTQAGNTLPADQQPEGAPDWFCLDGGSDRLIDGMLAYLGKENHPVMGKKVICIEPADEGKTMLVHVKGEAQPRRFAQVICTAPLSTLSSIDMTNCNLTFTQKTAIRALHYDASTKVALKWAKRWWEDPEVMGQGNTIQGGVTATDLPVRMVVYPSYGMQATGPTPGVMIGSYTWSQDAQVRPYYCHHIDHSKFLMLHPLPFSVSAHCPPHQSLKKISSPSSSRTSTLCTTSPKPKPVHFSHTPCKPGTTTRTPGARLRSSVPANSVRQSSAARSRVSACSPVSRHPLREVVCISLARRHLFTTPGSLAH